MMTQQEEISAAVAHHQGGRLAQAEELYRQIIAREPNHPDVNNNLGVICRQRGDLQDAIACFRRAATSAPEHIAVLNNLGSALWQARQREEAIFWLRAALVLNPASADGQFNLGSCFMALGRMDESMSAYRQAAALRPDFAEAHNNLGLIWYDRMNFAAAVECFRRAVAARGDYADGINNLGLACKYASYWDEAAAAFSRVLALRPHEPDTYWNLIDLHQRKNASAAAAHADLSGLPRLAHIGDKVVLLRCDRAVRERLRAAGLHSGDVVNALDGTEPWLAAQFAADSDAATLRNQVGMWLEWTRNEAAMRGLTCAFWLPEIPPAAVEICRSVCGDDLIEMTGATAEEIHDRLSALKVPVPDTEGKTFAVVSIRNGGVELLPHWLEHYTRMGVDEILVGVFEDLPGEARRMIEQCAARWNFRQFAQRWNSTSEEEQYSRRQTACRLAGAQPGTWIMHADLDEFHQYPGDIRGVTAAAELKLLDTIHGRFVDRVAADGSLPPVHPQNSLWDQFPIECKLTERILNGGTQKVMLAKYNVRVRPGHHEAVDRPPAPPPVGTANDYCVAHFKWHGGVLSRMRWGLEQEKPSPAWKREARKFVSWYAANGGRIDVAHPLLEAVKPAASVQ